ncbi:uncharacterized protein NPIL_355421 [Nephila pilipes]|uniref:CCHC-type domain-containing protein n=1 Tax=Nephila pilipes TaxID=299642 RepID=A0A8X6UHR9_NEPPI|nr:uncharacterized protein NPIL_355421 [Nephila pilipes]
MEDQNDQLNILCQISSGVRRHIVESLQKMFQDNNNLIQMFKNAIDLKLSDSHRIIIRADQTPAKNNLGLEKAIEIVRAADASREQIRNMKYETATVNFLKKKENPNQPKKSSQYECKKMWKETQAYECPAFGKICTKCNEKNHFAAKCFQNTRNIHEMNFPEKEWDVYIDSVTVTETKCEMIN